MYSSSVQGSLDHIMTMVATNNTSAINIGICNNNYTDAKQVIQCANCGGIGHVYKSCNHPITSYGIICFRLCFVPDKGWTPQYLMVQRKDSLSYVEFIRGKYSIDQRAYIMKLFSNMTASERNGLATGEFDVLWKTLWQSESCRNFAREYNEAKSKFEMLRRGYIMKNTDNEVYYFDVDFIVNNTVCNVYEPEWGFPKGRRNINEQDFNCAVREFKEETGIQPKHISVIANIKPVEEIFSGTNKIRYKHVYYVAACVRPELPIGFNPKNKTQSREIKDVQWFDYENGQTKIDKYNIERKELFKRVHSVIGKYIDIKYTQGVVVNNVYYQ